MALDCPSLLSPLPKTGNSATWLGLGLEVGLGYGSGLGLGVMGFGLEGRSATGRVRSGQSKPIGAGRESAVTPLREGGVKGGGWAEGGVRVGWGEGGC